MKGRRPRILVEGTGISALTAARLLDAAGADVVVAGVIQDNDRLVAIPLSSLQMTAELWDVRVEELLTGHISKTRQVSWESDDGMRIADSAMITNLAQFTHRLRQILEKSRVIFADDAHACDAPDWALLANRPIPNDAAAGTRVVLRAQIAPMPDLTEGPLVAAVQDGWVFAAQSHQVAAEIFLFTPAEHLTEVPRTYIRRAAEEVFSSPVTVYANFPPATAAPALAQCAGWDRTLLLGETALRLDPLRGDGIGYAVRGALLAQAVVMDALRSDVPHLYVEHYDRRLRQVFRDHVGNCCRHYLACWNAALWKDEIARMTSALDSHGSTTSDFSYQLHGRTLVPADAVDAAGLLA